MSYLFQCAIGPVQDFIATARRSRDLWYGSWMLSELSKAAARVLAERFGVKSLIFPAPRDIGALNAGSDLNVGNKIVAIISEDGAAVSDEIWKGLTQRLEELRDEAFKEVKASFEKLLAERQLADLVEFYWVSVPIAEGQYDIARRQADAILAARKATRGFVQVSGASAPKSSLDGARESVIPESAYPGRDDSEREKTRMQNRLYWDYGARRGERLSGVDLIKRHGMRGKDAEQKFRSTSHMAALPFLNMIDREKGSEHGEKLLADLITLLRQHGMNPQGEDGDGSLLFESRLREWAPDDATLEQARKSWNERITQDAGKRRPEPYYALLVADGDNMGKTIDAQRQSAKHRDLSEALSGFALESKAIIEQHQGVPVYTGGDDILAYLPVHTALECAEELDRRFNQVMRKLTLGVSSPTLSIGIVVAHHLDPLADTLELGRDAERTAKSVKGKYGLAITLSKRSGVDRTISGKLDVLSERMSRLITFTRQGAISKAVAYELQEMSRVLGQGVVPNDAVVKDAVRIVERRRESGGEQEIAEHVRVAFEQWLEVAGLTPHELAQELIVAGAFANAIDLAQGSLTEDQTEVTA